MTGTSGNQPARARIRGSERTAGEQCNGYEGRAEQSEGARPAKGVDIAKATLEATAWREGRAVRLGTLAQTADGWVALRDAVVGLQGSPAVSAGRRGQRTPTASRSRSGRSRRGATRRRLRCGRGGNPGRRSRRL